MSGVFVLLFLITFVLLIISLVKPGFLNRIIKRELSRKQSSLGIGAILLILFVLIGITGPKTEIKGESTVRESSPSPTLEPTPTPTLSPSPTPSPTPSSTPTPTPSPSPTPSLLPLPTPTSIPTPTIIATPTPTPQPNNSSTSNNCDPSYPDVCIPIGAADYDCAGGSGNGPNYIQGPIRVLPPDPYDLDRDNDGIGCE